jgi:hypothetical protein
MPELEERTRPQVASEGFGSAGVGQASAVAFHPIVGHRAGAQPLGSLGSGRRPDSRRRESG